MEEVSTLNSDFPITLDEIIKQIIKNEDFVKCEIDKRCISLNGNNYLSNLYEVDIKGRTKETDKELNIFVKRIIKLELFVLISVPNLYKSELFVYKELSKIFETLQEEVQVPLEKRYQMAKIYQESNSETIIMENLTKRGFTTCFRMDVMPLNFAKKSVEQLAKFHALSFVLREKRSVYFETKIKSIKHPHIFNDEWKKLVKNSREVALNHIDEEFKGELKKTFLNFLEKYPKYCKDETIKTCLCHGDYKLNNIMVRLHGCEIEDTIPIDYQHIHYGCPVFDFLFFIYTGTDRYFRQCHMSSLKNLYYKTLSNFLKYFNIEANKVYPRNCFENIFYEKQDFGLLITLVYLPFFFVAENQAPDVSKQQSNFSISVDVRYKDRLKGLVEDYIEMGHI